MRVVGAMGWELSQGDRRGVVRGWDGRGVRMVGRRRCFDEMGNDWTGVKSGFVWT